MDEMINQTDQFLLKLKTRSEEIMMANIDSEINYIFTNDEDYLNRRTKLIPRNDKDENIKQKQADPKQQQQPIQKLDSKEERERLKKEAEKMFVKELRLRVDHYFHIVIRTLRVIIFLFRKLFLRILETFQSVNLNNLYSTPSTMNF